MSAVSTQPQSAFKTFAIFALVGSVVGALVLFVPHIPNFVRSVAADSRLWLTLVDLALVIYPLGIWPGVLVGAAVAWRDRSSGSTSLLFSITASIVAVIIWTVVVDYIVFPDPAVKLFSETNVRTLGAFVIAGIFCWWLSRARADSPTAD